jgi:hypothetical protein
VEKEEEAVNIYSGEEDHQDDHANDTDADGGGVPAGVYRPCVCVTPSESCPACIVGASRVGGVGSHLATSRGGAGGGAGARGEGGGGGEMNGRNAKRVRR